MYSGMQQTADHSVDNIIIDNRFLGNINETYERYVFNTRKQKARETVDDYVAALCILASTCNFCNCLKDSLMRDRIVSGIKDSSTRKRLLQEADLNLETCIAMCRAAEATSPSQPVKAMTWTEDTTAVQAGSVSSGDQRPGKKQDFSLSLRHCDPMAPPDHVEMSEVNFKTELDDSDDSAFQWTAEHQSSGFPRDRTEHNKQEPAWSMEDDSPDQPSAVYSTVQPMSVNISGSLLSLNTSHECYLCSAAFVLVSSLELHLASVHGEKLHMVLPGPSTPDRCDAGNCSNTDSHSKKKMKTRKVNKNATCKKNRKNSSKQHGCDVCKKSFLTPGGLERHKLINCGIKSFVCDVCGKGFTLAGVLKTHKLIHSGHKPFVCDVCGKSFTRAGGLKDHKRVHTKERPYKCPHCDSCFTQSGHLQLHVRSTHEGHRPHLCDICGAAFFDSVGLRAHRRTHTGEKPHVCSVCGKGFAQSGTLAKHCRIHTGNKPHMCSDCGKSFTTAGHLTRHRLTHTGERPHVCSLCGKSFSQLGNLATHCLIHSGGKPHNCPHCPSAFRYSQQLKAHIQSDHQLWYNW